MPLLNQTRGRLLCALLLLAAASLCSPACTSDKNTVRTPVPPPPPRTGN